MHHKTTTVRPKEGKHAPGWDRWLAVAGATYILYWWRQQHTSLTQGGSTIISQVELLAYAIFSSM